MGRPALVSLLTLALALSSGAASAHPVTVDGNPADWLTRTANGDNLGLVARAANGQGEYVWRDVAADTRTDIASPEVVADIAAFQVTGDAQNIYFLLRRQPGAMFSGQPIQVQIAIDTDRVAGSGQDFFAEFADTKVAEGARWERLVETLFGSGGTAKVIDTSFNQVSLVSAVAGANGDIEIAVPWTALGLAGPPATPLRFTVATFRAQSNDVTVDIGGPQFSNALDCVSDYGDPTAAMFPNTYQDVQDLVVDYSFDVHFGVNGEVYAPLVVQRFLANAPGGSSDEWYLVRNTTSASLSLAGFKIGDEETPDGAEGMFSFPPSATLPAGGSFVVARAGATYQTFFGVAPDGELPPGGSMAIADLAAYPQWTSAAMPNLQLANTGDEILLLDPSNTIVDVAVFGTGVYPGVTAFTPAPGASEVLSRSAASGDTDSCQVDFTSTGVQCVTDMQCGGGSACSGCFQNACGPKPAGTPCPDADVCNGDEACDGAGTCAPAMGPACDDSNPCTVDGCAPMTGCTHTNVAAGTSCADANVCNGDEACNANGACQAGMPLDCDDTNPCTMDACDAVTGCQSTNATDGTACPDDDACNGDETCAMGVCESGMAPSCDDQNSCTDDACDMMNGCQNTPVTDGTACNDGCAGVCAAGTCDCGMGGGGPGGGGQGGSGQGGGATTGSTSSSSSTGSGPSSTGVGGDATGGGGGGSDEDDGGCSCKTAGGSSSDAGALVLLGLVGALLRRQKRGARP
ncbi:MAG: lamin tail domain-containing protein [Myxococcales bacterium]|nr:lamin tail domain-containing protein [Myxococcales bacterium]